MATQALRRPATHRIIRECSAMYCCSTQDKAAMTLGDDCSVERGGRTEALCNTAITLSEIGKHI
jgi:hypothetical protein